MAMTRPKTQRPPAPIFVDDYLPALLALASDLISSEFHRIVTAQGFTVTQWRILASLSGGQPLSIGELTRMAMSKQPTVTRLVNQMQERGDVERIDDAGDRRVTLVRITPAGSRTVAGLITLARRHEARVLRPFGAQRSVELKQALKRMIEMQRAAGAA
jgi:DNA-binding MarR family transcriptional regulator